MTPILRKLVCIALLICMVTILTPTTTANAKEQSDPITPGLGYTFLETDRQRVLYKRIAECFVNCTGTADISDLEFQQEADLLDINLAYSMVRSDFPECFWVGSYYVYDLEQIDIPYELTPFVPLDPFSSEMLSAQVLFQKRVNAIIAGIPSDAISDKEKAVYLYRYVQNHCMHYSESCQSAYGPLVLGGGTSGGYIYAYSCLLKTAGIASMVITGKTSDSSNCVWILAKLDGQYYYVESLYYDSFLSKDDLTEYIPDSDFSILQSIETGKTIDFSEIDGNPLPSNYGYAQASDNTKANEIISRFVAEKQSDGTINDFHCIVLFNGSDWDGWICKTIPEIAGLLGFGDSYQYSARPYSYTDNAEKSYWVSIFGYPGASDTFSVSDILLNHSSVAFTNELQSIQLEADVLPLYAQNTNITYVSSDPSVAKVEANTGIITPVSNGSAIISVIAEDNGLTRQCAVTVNLNDTHTHTTPLRKVAALPASCETNGHTTYYVCDACWQWFSSSDGRSEFLNRSDIILPALGHIYGEWGAATDEVHSRVCTRTGCSGFNMVDQAEHIDSNNDGACDVCGYGAQSPTTPSVTEPNQTTPTQTPTTPTTTPPTQQTTPPDTTDPSETATPSSPSNPTESTTPSVPASQPTIPSDPTENVSSSNPSNPSVESIPGTSSTPAGITSSGNPEPGNDDHPNSTWIIYVALLLGVAGIISYLIYKRKVKSS